MREPFTQLYVHCVWSTWDRLPLITPTIERVVYSCIRNKCRELKCDDLAIGGTADHIHLLIQIPATVYVAKVVGEVKGSSSHLINSRFPEEGLFKWQGAYGAFSVSRSMVPKVKEYIEKQKRHHAENTLSSEFEPPMDEDE